MPCARLSLSSLSLYMTVEDADVVCCGREIRVVGNASSCRCGNSCQGVSASHQIGKGRFIGGDAEGVAAVSCPRRPRRTSASSLLWTSTTLVDIYKSLAPASSISMHKQDLQRNMTYQRSFSRRQVSSFSMITAFLRITNLSCMSSPLYLF